MADVDAVVAALALDGAVLVGEDKYLALIQVDGLPDRLRPRALGHEQELSTRVVFFAAAQNREDLEGEAHLAVDVLVQGVVIALLVAQDQRRLAQDQRRRPRLSLVVATLQELMKRVGICLLRAQLLRPIVGHLRERRVKGLPESLHHFG